MIRIHKSKEMIPLTMGFHYWYTVHAPNGEILVHSENYTRKANCTKSIKSLQKVMRSDFEVVDETK